MSVWIIRSNFPNKEEATKVARNLLEARLAACANINEGTTAIYHWEDMIQQEQEVVLLAKTTKEKVSQAMARIKELHSYRIPSIIGWQVDACDETFAGWVSDVVA